MENAKILRLPTVIARVGVSRPTIYLWIKKGTFPAQLKIGPNTAGWLATEVDAWIAKRASERVANWNGEASR